jgi:hypothetical protein
MRSQIGQRCMHVGMTTNYVVGTSSPLWILGHGFEGGWGVHGKVGPRGGAIDFDSGPGEKKKGLGLEAQFAFSCSQVLCVLRKPSN